RRTLLQTALNSARFRWKTLAGSAGAISLAAGAALLLSLLAGPAAGSRERHAIVAPGGASIDATHLPPLLRLPDEKVTLRYDIACASADEAEGECRGSGTVYVRAGDAGPFQPLPLGLVAQAPEGRYAV